MNEIINIKEKELKDIKNSLFELRKSIKNYIYSNLKISNIKIELDFNDDINKNVLKLNLIYKDSYTKFNNELEAKITKSGKICFKKHSFFFQQKNDITSQSMLNTLKVENQTNEFFILFINYFQKNELKELYQIKELFLKQNKITNDINSIKNHIIYDKNNKKLNSILSLLKEPLNKDDVNDIFDNLKSFCCINLNHSNKVEINEYSIEVSGFERITYYIVYQEKKKSIKIKDLKTLINNSIKYNGKVIESIDSLFSILNKKEYKSLYSYEELTIEDFSDIFEFTLKLKRF